MNGRSAKALRKVFRANDNPENFKQFKRALRGSEPDVKKRALQTARDIVSSGKTIYHGKLPDGGN